MPPRRRRRAVGPPGARPAQAEPTVLEALRPDPADEARGAPDEDERLRADRPPHHDRGV